MNDDWNTRTKLVHEGTRRSQYGEVSEAIFLTQGFVYETAEDVPEAWEVLEELEEMGAEVVIIVSDWLMPGVRGDEFLIEVRRKHPQIARVMLTGQADEDALHIGVALHLAFVSEHFGSAAG